MWTLFKYFIIVRSIGWDGMVGKNKYERHNNKNWIKYYIYSLLVYSLKMCSTLHKTQTVTYEKKKQYVARSHLIVNIPTIWSVWWWHGISRYYLFIYLCFRKNNNNKKNISLFMFSRKFWHPDMNKKLRPMNKTKNYCN